MRMRQAREVSKTKFEKVSKEQGSKRTEKRKNHIMGRKEQHYTNK